MNKNSESFLKKFLETPSPSGFEQPAAKLFRAHVKDHVDDVYGDVHGNSIAVLNPDAPFTFMLAGHIDEIGLMITHIEDNGYIYTGQIGGMDPALLIGQRVRILSAKGEVFGVIGRKAIHQMTPEERTKAVKMDNIWVDIGASSLKDAEKRVAIGDPMVIDVECRKLTKDLMVSRAMDDKAGAFVVAEVMRALSKRKLKICVMGVATVQEEIGLRGAEMIAQRIKPDLAIITDVCHDTTSPGYNKIKQGDQRAGNGPVLSFAPAVHNNVLKMLFDVAGKNKIDFQRSALSRFSGTDTDAFAYSNEGVAAALISLPIKYMHTTVEMADLKDIDNVIKLMYAFLLQLDAGHDFSYIKKD